MQLYKKKKVEIVAEAVLQQQILKMIEDEGAKGYTVIPEAFGKGHRGVRNEAHVSNVFINVLIIVIAEERIAMRIIENAQPLLKNYAGIVYVSEVDVVRDEHF
jgi:PII-like signaling protein